MEAQITTQVNEMHSRCLTLHKAMKSSRLRPLSGQNVDINGLELMENHVSTVVTLSGLS